MDALLAFVLGVVTSAVVAVSIDRGGRPFIQIGKHTGKRAQGQNPDAPPHEFFHVVARNRPARWPLSGRRPAWSCKASLEIVSDDGKDTRIGPIPARWTSRAEPLTLIGTTAGVAQIPDVALMHLGRRMDVHNHEDEALAVAVKFESEDDCFLFTNESYLFARWSNPEWRLGAGKHRLRVTVSYESGRAPMDFWLNNGGRSRNEMHINDVVSAEAI